MRDHDKSSRPRIANNGRMSEPSISLEFWSACIMQRLFVLPPPSPAFSSVSMTGDKFVFNKENCCCSGVFSLIKGACESEWIVRCVGKDSSEGWRDRLDTGVREAN